LHLDEDCPEDFELVIQWIYTDRVVPVPRKLHMKTLALLQDKITRYLDFIMLCNKLLLLGEWHAVIGAMRDCLVEDRRALLPQHVRSAVTLCSEHPVRRLFAEAAAVGYLDAAAREKPEGFSLAKEVKEFEGFASDLLIVCGEIWGSRSYNKSRNIVNMHWKDPLCKGNRSTGDVIVERAFLGNSEPR